MRLYISRKSFLINTEDYAVKFANWHIENENFRLKKKERCLFGSKETDRKKEQELENAMKELLNVNDFFK